MQKKIQIPASVQKMIEAIVYAKELREAKLTERLLTQSFQHSDQRCAIEYQNIRVTNFFSRIKSDIPYFADILKGIDINSVSDLVKIPIMDKTTIRKNFSRLISKNKNILNSFKFNTGGSTGEPLTFYASRQCGLVDRYHQSFLFSMNNFHSKNKIFAFDGTVVPKEKRAKQIFWLRKSEKEIPYGSYHFSSHYFSHKTEKFYIRKFLEFKPEYLRGYPSFISMFSEALLRNEINPSFVKGIHLTAENIFEHQIEAINRVFRCPVFRQYGHSEMAVFGFSPPDSANYYCSPYYGVTEVLDDQGQHVKIGETGEIVVTGFHNHIMPFVRYKTGDHAVFGGFFNRFVVLNQIMGRTQDFLVDKNGLKIPVTGLVFGQHFQSFEKIVKWQLQQKKPGYINVLIVPSENYTKTNEQEILNKFSEGDRFEIKIKYVSDLNLTHRGKMCFVVNRLLQH